MTGRQLKVQGIGSTNEAFCEALVGRIASMIPVPREHDFGVDYYCLPRRELTSHTETVGDIAAIQVKPDSDCILTFGGSRGNDPTWHRHELDWLRALRVPLYLAIVDSKYERVNLHSISRCLQVFLKTWFPFAIRCEPSPLDLTQSIVTQTAEPVAIATVAPTEQHDGAVWSVQLGTPFLTLTFSQLDDPRQREWVTKVFSRWIDTDSATLANLKARIPVVHIPQAYFANVPPSIIQNIMFWYPSQSGRAKDVAGSVAPAIASIARQLLSEGRTDEAKQWLPALEWCQAHDAIEQFGRDVAVEINALLHDSAKQLSTEPSIS
jgi:hypothetical protein